MPDADMETSLRVILDSAFGCAGQRCLAASVALPVGEARTTFTPLLLDAARSRKIGFGLDPDVELGPVITSQSRERIANLVGRGVAEGGALLVDGRDVRVSGYETGNFIGATVLEVPNANGELGRTEIFGPVLSVTNTATIDEAIAVVNASAFGNMACLFTSSGAAARNSATRHESATSASTSALQRRWPSSRSPDRRVASSATFTPRGGMRSTSTWRRRSSSSAGRGNGHAASDADE